MQFLKNTLELMRVPVMSRNLKLHRNVIETPIFAENCILSMFTI
jgi:hypothetical protein